MQGKNMFNLDQSINEWRRQLLAAGIQTTALLEELESHLREDVERQVRSGLDGQQAFESAVRRMGRFDALKAEFAKAGGAGEVQLGKLLGIACAGIAGFFSLLAMQKLIVVHGAGPVARILGLAAAATTLLSWRYGHRLLPVIRQRHLRTAIGIACCGAGMAGVGLFLKLILPRLMEVPAGADIPVGTLLASFLWAWAVMAILAGMAYGLEKAASRQVRAAGS